MKVFGRVVNLKDTITVSRLLYSDWHCSVFFEEESSVAVVCGSEKTKISCDPRLFCSNSSHLFVLTVDGIILSFSKATSVVSTLELASCRFIAANDEELYCISMDDFLVVYPIKDLNRKPKPNYPLPMKVKSVACGAGFALFLTPSGVIFSKGIGTRGQLGHGDLESRSTPEAIEALRPVTSTAIACGFLHSACLTDTGDVYTWGSNEFGQLGYPSLNLERSRQLNNPFHPSDLCVNVNALPAPVDFPDDCLITAIACGSRHTVCLSEDNNLYSFGWNGFGQLGLEPESGLMVDRYPYQTASDRVNRVNLPFSSQKQLLVTCGHWCTIIKELQVK